MAEQAGYLTVETRADRPGLVRIQGTHTRPAEPRGPPSDRDGVQLRYAASFGALHVALMHAQTALRHQMVDAESGLYRVGVLEAVAAVDAIDLQHRRVYLDPGLDADPRLEEQVERRRRRHRLIDRIWTAVGVLAILLLLLFSQIPVF